MKGNFEIKSIQTEKKTTFKFATETFILLLVWLFPQ